MLFFFPKDFSGAIKARGLKLGMQRNNDDLYPVRDSELSRLICSFVLLFFFLSILANGKFLVKDFSGIIKGGNLKPGMQCNEVTYIVQETMDFLGLFVQLFFSSSFSPYRPILNFLSKISSEP